MTNIICSCQSDEATIRQAGERFVAAAPHMDCARTEAARLYTQAILTLMAAGAPPSDLDPIPVAMMAHSRLGNSYIKKACEAAKREGEL